MTQVWNSLRAEEQVHKSPISSVQASMGRSPYIYIFFSIISNKKGLRDLDNHACVTESSGTSWNPDFSNSLEGTEIELKIGRY